MPIYNFRNTKTGEEKHDELISIAEMKQFIKDNPDWIVTPQLPPGKLVGSLIVKVR